MARNPRYPSERYFRLLELDWHGLAVDHDVEDSLAAREVDVAPRFVAGRIPTDVDDVSVNPTPSSLRSPVAKVVEPYFFEFQSSHATDQPGAVINRRRLASAISMASAANAELLRRPPVAEAEH